MPTYSTLHEANLARQKLWDPENKITLEFRGLELGEEMGELLKLLKRVARFRMGIKGGRGEADVYHEVIEEVGDILIVLDLILMDLGYDDMTTDCLLARRKFNMTSRKYGFDCFVEELSPFKPRWEQDPDAPTGSYEF